MIHQTALPARLTMDLNFAQRHALLLDVDAKGPPPHRSLTDQAVSAILSVLRTVLLPQVEHFTAIFAVRASGHGLHVHLPEFEVCNDDYERFCVVLRPRLNFNIGQVSYSLDVPANWCLTTASKPGSPAYRPHCVAYVEERLPEPLFLRLDGPPELFSQSLKVANSSFARRKRKGNSKSLFRTILLFQQESELRLHVLGAMMPVTVLLLPFYKLSYATSIVPATGGDDDNDSDIVATYQMGEQTHLILKSRNFRTDGVNWLKTCYHLKFNAYVIQHFESQLRALCTWYRRNRDNACVVDETAPSCFRSLNTALKEENFNFYDDPNPIKTIMEYDDGYYFLPVFYALTQHLNMEAEELVHTLQSMIDPRFGHLINRLESLPESHFKSITKHLTVATIHYCGHHLYPKPASMQDKLTAIMHESKRLVMTACGSTDAMTQLLRTIQRRHFPIMVVRLACSTKKPSRFMWNFYNEAWFEVANHNEVYHLMQNVWSAMQAYVRSNAALCGNDLKGLEKIVNLPNVVQSILSDTNMERRWIAMDRQMWLVRVSEVATVDLLTRHVGATVPEYYISERRLGLDHLDRRTFARITDPGCVLASLYEMLTSKRFFRRYLKACLTDATDDLFDTLRELVQPPSSEDPVVTAVFESVLRAYVHLCKYICFEYDVMLYVLDLFSSVLVATNYERKFVVFKGKTRNGKSKLFQILLRLFGGYAWMIRPENLRPSSGSGGGAALPELASTLFSCRLVILDEIGGKLNENLIKEITGNSTVTFRNLYEQTQGGVPMAKIFTSTNREPDVISTQAFYDRIVAVPFGAKFDLKPPATTSEQVSENVYQLERDEATVENSYMGFWTLLWFHFLKHVDLNDGCVPYREMPECLVDFKASFLANTDVYDQFKIAMDVQVVAGAITTSQDLVSAVRQFLHTFKDKSIQEVEIKQKFDDEFKSCKKHEVCLGSYRSEILQDVALLDDDPPRAKKPRIEDERYVHYYENVSIKNLKRQSLNDM